MITAITKGFLQQITNPVFKQHAEIYLEIDDDFRKQVSSFGLPFARSADSAALFEQAALLEQKGLTISNDCKSLHTGWISQSCVQCRKGLGTATFLLSVQCPRNCFFCFNPNQIDYERLLHETNDIIAQIDEYHRKGANLTDLALTGGEPLVHLEETISFFKHADSLYPRAYTRLYTSGAFLDKSALERLAATHLDEIRFSIKLDEGENAQRDLLALMELSRRYVDHIVVEMPVMPDAVKPMKVLLDDLDDIGVSGINLLELCYPLHNAQEFARRGYEIKSTPYRVLYDYWYAGGLPIEGSERACLELLAYALERNLGLGVHYCSLENKFSGQIYLQNKPHENDFPSRIMSSRDYFLKSAKVFGADVELVRGLLEPKNRNHLEYDPDGPVLEFPPSLIPELKPLRPELELAISYGVAEKSQKRLSLRELKLDFTTPSAFDLDSDI